MSTFQALMLRQEDKKVSAAIETVANDHLPEGDVTIDVTHSSLNYKDGMIINGLGRLVREYPHIPGIDMVGTVRDSSHADFAVGDAVILTGWRVGEIHWGGYAQRARVKGEWLVKLPEGMTPVQAMTVGTAGITAMLAIMALEDHGLTPEAGKVLVTGAAGGLGSTAVTLLSRLGYEVAAVTGRAEQADYLKGLGATEIVMRSELEEASGKPLNREKWAGAVDTVGGKILSNLVTELAYGASVSCCGNAGGIDLNFTVLPLLLRGINLLGIDSVMCPTARRQVAWQRMHDTMPKAMLEDIGQIIGLADLPEYATKILNGEVRGRVVVDVNS